MAISQAVFCTILIFLCLINISFSSEQFNSNETNPDISKHQHLNAALSSYFKSSDILDPLNMIVKAIINQPTSKHLSEHIHDILSHLKPKENNSYINWQDLLKIYLSKISAFMNNICPVPEVTREKGNAGAIPSPWNELSFDPPAEMPICQNYQNSKVCCKKEQLEHLKDKMSVIANFFSKCPCCLQNIEDLFCTIICSPDQSLFFTPYASLLPTSQSQLISSIVSIPPAYADKMFNSCKDVKMSVNGSNVMKVLVNTSDYDTLFLLMSLVSVLPEHSYIPGMIMLFNFPKDDFPLLESNKSEPFSLSSLKPCSGQCSCIDCPGSCLPIPPISSPCLWSGYPCITPYLLCVVVTSFVLIVIAFIWVIVYHVKYLKKRDPTIEYVCESDSIYPYRILRPRMNKFTARVFYYHGSIVSKHPLKVIFISLIITAFFSSFIYRTDFITEPEELWAAPDAQASIDKHNFDNLYGPFYRLEQIIMTQTANSGMPIFNKSNLLVLQTIQNDLIRMVVTDPSTSNPFTIEDICFKPMKGKGCLVQSVLNYFPYQDVDDVDDVLLHLKVEGCSRYTTYLPPCFSEIGIPVDPSNIFGGFEGDDYMQSKALFMTFLVENAKENQSAIKAWELKFLEYMHSLNFEKQGLKFSYFAQRSLADEISKVGQSSVPTIIISYMVMFVYIALALGDFKKPYLVNTKILLAVGGIFTVILSIFLSAGVCTLFGIRATLVISEVIPFLVLAIGIDNIVILVDSFNRYSHIPFENRLSYTFASSGSSIMISSISQMLIFLLGILTQMPAVVSFAIYASCAILFDFLLQITLFSAFIIIDARRKESHRIDFLPCVTISSPILGDEFDEILTPLIESPEEENDPFISISSSNSSTSKIIEKFYAPFLFNKFVRTLVLITFTSMLITSLILMPSIEFGIELKEALLMDSYLVSYYNELEIYSHAGPPLYLVIDRPINYGNHDVQDLLCGIGSYSTEALSANGDKTDGPKVHRCLQDSLQNEFYSNASQLKSTFAKNLALSSWLDTYLLWLDPLTGCCMKKLDGTFCPAGFKSSDCIPCLSKTEYENNRPKEELFMKYISYWLTTECDMNCNTCGSVFNRDIVFDHTKPTDSYEFIRSSRFLGFHQPVYSQKDLIAATADAYNFSKLFQEKHNLGLFPYSLFYLFFVQYIDLKKTTFITLGIATVAAFTVSLLLLSNIVSSLLITALVLMIEIDLFGVMYLWGIHFNALALVNMIMAMGISIEFCIHICHYFLLVEGTSLHRSKVALVDMGASVFKGITLTKWAGIIVLGFAPSLIFRIYYFRMFISIVIIGFLHGLVLLPVLLSWFGPPTHKAEYLETLPPALNGDSSFITEREEDNIVV